MSDSNDSVPAPLRPYVKPVVERIPLAEARGAVTQDNFTLLDSETNSS